MREQSSEEVAEDPGTPCSPLTSFVRDNFDEHFPKMAVVHKVCLRDASLLKPPGPESMHHDGRPWSSECSTRLPSKDRARELSTDDRRRISKNAASYFHESTDENHKALNGEQVDALLKEVRRKRMSSKEAPGAGRGGHLEAVADVQMSRASSKASSAAKDDAPQQKDVKLGASGETKKPAKSFLEQFGYGVKPKTPEEGPKDLPPELAPRDTRKNGFVGISKGKNDLKERLAAKRRHSVA